MATSLEESEKLVQIDNIHTNTFHLVKKVVKIGPVHHKIALLNLRKERKKLRKVKYIAQSRSLPSGLIKFHEIFKGKFSNFHTLKATYTSDHFYTTSSTACTVLSVCGGSGDYVSFHSIHISTYGAAIFSEQFPSNISQS